MPLRDEDRARVARAGQAVNGARATHGGKNTAPPDLADKLILIKARVN